MPKYYVSDGIENIIIDAPDHMFACVHALESEKLHAIISGGFYIVSERGFDPHDDDVAISSDDVNDLWMALKNDDEA